MTYDELLASDRLKEAQHTITIIKEARRLLKEAWSGLNDAGVDPLPVEPTIGDNDLIWQSIGVVSRDITGMAEEFNDNYIRWSHTEEYGTLAPDAHKVVAYQLMCAFELATQVD